MAQVVCAVHIGAQSQFGAVQCGVDLGMLECVPGLRRAYMKWNCCVAEYFIVIQREVEGEQSGQNLELAPFGNKCFHLL